VQVDVFFGPCCDYAAAPVARQTRYWKIPIVTVGAMARDYGVDRNKEFPMLTRVGANFNSLTQFLMKLLINFKWRSVIMVYDPQGHGTEIEKFCHLTVDSIHQTILKEEYKIDGFNDNITQEYHKFVDSKQFDNHTMTEKIGRKFASKYFFDTINFA
jgi:Receptor family ligand binding region